MTVTVISDNRKTKITAQQGGSLYELMLKNGLYITAPCSGKHTCGKCKVKVGGLRYTEEENRLLTDEEKSKNIHLACCVTVEDNMTVYTETEKEAEIITAVSGVTYNAPIVTRREVNIDAPTLVTQLSDYERVCMALGMQCKTDIDVLRELADKSRTATSCVLYGDRLITLDNSNKVYGMAVDIGTTSVAIYLYDLTDGKCVDVYTELNRQSSFGADVISRCEYASHGKNELNALNETLIASVNSAIEHFNTKDIYHIVFVGNTVMMHMLMKIDPCNIANAPFIPVTTDRITLKAAELGINLDSAVVDVLPSVAGFVGADTVAAVMASGMHESDELSLLIDIGTNGEMVLGNSEKMLCCSAAAGPAFEGAHIRCGMGGIRGAINRVNDDFSYTVIGGGKPEGICGSGLLDAVYALVKSGNVSTGGRFKTADKKYVIGETVEIVQRDVRELQLAKGAICAGIEILLKTAGVRASDVKKLYLAGGFGNYMNPRSAVGIGVFPAELSDKIVPIGNAAGAGAGKALLSGEALQNAENVRDKMKYIELSTVKEFQDLFADNMELTERYMD